MLVLLLRRNISSNNLRRGAACIISRNKTKIKVAQHCNESNLLSTSLPHLAACRIYSTERDSQPSFNLPPLSDTLIKIPSIITPFKLLYSSIFKITPYIDKDFHINEVLQGAKYASIIISTALANKNFESLEGLVTDDMIEILTKKIETLSPNQRQLIELREDDILFYVLSDIAATTGSEHSIEVTTLCHYLPGLAEKRHNISTTFADYASTGHLICTYKFIRKYVNNVGGPWVATMVNHFSTI